MDNIFFLKLRILPRWIIVLMDLVILFCSALLAYLLRFNFDLERFSDFNVIEGVLTYTLTGTVIGLATRSYAGIIRYTGLQDAGRIFTTATLTFFITGATSYFIFYNYGYLLIPVSVLIIAYLTSLLFLFSYRLLVKEIFTFFLIPDRKKANVIIYGSNKSAITTRHILENDHRSRRRVVAYVDHNLQKVGKVINGLRIYDARKDLQRLFQIHSVRELIISDKTMSLERKNQIVDICLVSNVKVRTIPPVEHWIKGELSIKQIRDINIEELLERESIRLNNFNIKHEIKGKRVMVTGAAGSIGTELVRQVLFYRASQIIMVDQAESDLFDVEQEIMYQKGTLEVIPVLADITNEERMDAVFEQYKPEIIFHAAAYKHVPMMERNPTEATLCNIGGTKILADLAVKYGAAKFIMVSTDKAVNPSNVMGATKRIAEIYVQSLNNFIRRQNPEATGFITTRFGNVLGSKGSVIPLFKKQIEKGGPVTVTHPDIKRYFMTIPEACQLVLEASAMGKGGEIFVFDMGKSIKIVDLAKKMILLSGFEPGRDIDIQFSGLRSGEKLYEELLNAQENTLPTYHHKIMIAKTREEDYHVAREQIELLLNAALDRDDMKLVGIMKYLVPEFHSQSSPFEVLDKKQATGGKASDEVISSVPD